MKKQSRKTIQNRCDKNWSIIVRNQAGNKCQMCGKDEGVLNAHHIISRKHKPSRWLLYNGVALCYRCHMFKAHGDDLIEQQEWYNFLIEELADKYEKAYGVYITKLWLDPDFRSTKPLPIDKVREIDEALKLAVSK